MQKLQQTARSIEPTPRGGAPGSTLAVGKIVRCLGPSALTVEVDGELAEAKTAFGCIVRPIEGDRVLCAQTESEVFVLSVLDRLIPDAATLSLPGAGAIVVEAHSLRLRAREEASIDAPNFDIRARRLHMIADSLTFFGKVSHWIAEAMRMSARTLETTADTLSQTAVNRLAVVEGADVLRAGSVSQSIDAVTVTAAPAVVIAATQDLRLDGERVTVG